MTCDQYRALFPLLDDGALGPAERAELERHLGDCADCAAAMGEYRAVGVLLGGYDPATEGDAIDFDAQYEAIVARARGDERRRAGIFALWSRKARYVAAAAVVGFTATASYVVFREPGAVRQEPPAAMEYPVAGPAAAEEAFTDASDGEEAGDAKQAERGAKAAPPEKRVQESPAAAPMMSSQSVQEQEAAVADKSAGGVSSMGRMAVESHVAAAAEPSDMEDWQTPSDTVVSGRVLVKVVDSAGVAVAGIKIFFNKKFVGTTGEKGVFAVPRELAGGLAQVEISLGSASATGDCKKNIPSSAIPAIVLFRGVRCE